MGTTDVQSLPVPDPGTSNNFPGDLLAFGAAVEVLTVMRFASVAARDLALPPAKCVDGMECWTSNGTAAKRWTRYAGAWIDTTPQPGAWTEYTPVISGPSSVNYGTGALRTGAYSKSGRDVRGHAEIRFGAGMAFGSGGDWNIPLPVACLRAQVLGSAWMFDGDTTNYVGAYVAAGGSSTQAYIRPHGAVFTTNNARPFTWAATDQVYVEYSYEAIA